MSQPVVTALASLAMILATGGLLPGQLTGTLNFEVSSETSYVDECDPGAPCQVVYCGFIEGTLTLEYVSFDGVFDRYDVTALNWSLYRTICGDPPAPTPLLLTGTGTFEVDREAIPGQRLQLELEGLSALPRSFDSGLVTPTIPFPTFDSFQIFCFPSAETIGLHAELIADPPFSRADTNDDGNVNIGDPLYSLAALFVAGAPQPSCMDAADADDDGQHNLVDPLYVLGALFSQGPPPPPPVECGGDPTSDTLDCESYISCPAGP